MQNVLKQPPSRVVLGASVNLAMEGTDSQMELLVSKLVLQRMGVWYMIKIVAAQALSSMLLCYQL
ncbi:hypothetical protein KI387_019295, partial [Taxus chinensis]